MVAKLYQNLEIVSKEPFWSEGKKYVEVKTSKGAIKVVRWYSDYEYAKLYKEEPDHSKDPFYRTQKSVLGFDKGYITIFKGDTLRQKIGLKNTAQDLLSALSGLLILP